MRQHYKILLILLFCGAASTISLAPLHITPAIYMAIAILFHYLKNPNLSIRYFCFYIGCFMFGYLAMALYPLAFSLLPFDQDYIIFAPLMPISLGILFASYYMVLGAGVAYLRQKYQLSPFLLALLLIVIFALGDYWRGYFLTGSTWAKFMFVWGVDIKLWQIGFFIGEEALNIITIISLFLFAYGVTQRDYKNIVMALLLPICLWFYGHDRINNNVIEYDQIKKVRIIQPNINLRDKWDITKKYHNISQMLNLAFDARDDNIKILIFPETAITLFGAERQAILHYLAQVTPKNGYSIIGAPMRHQTMQNTYSNSMIAIDDNAQINTRFDKHHLMPFGEYVPFLQWWDVANLIANTGSYYPGDESLTWHLTSDNNDDYRLLPLICYEIIFPFNHHLRQQAHIADAIINITNDAWLGSTSGPYQHLRFTQWRAIASGLPIYRSANTGISAAIDAYGNIKASLALNKTGYIDVAYLPKVDTNNFSDHALWFYRQHISFFILLLLLISPIVKALVVAKRGD